MFRMSSKVIQLYISICLLFFRLFCIIGYYKILNSSLCFIAGPCWLSINILYSSVHLLTPNSQFIPPVLSPLVTITFFSVPVSLFLWISSFVSFLFRCHIQILYDICLFLTSLGMMMWIHPCGCKWCYLILFYGWEVFHYVYTYIYIYIHTHILHLLYPFTSWNILFSSMSWLL